MVTANASHQGAQMQGRALPEGTPPSSPSMTPPKSMDAVQQTQSEEGNDGALGDALPRGRQALVQMSLSSWLSRRQDPPARENPPLTSWAPCLGASQPPTLFPPPPVVPCPSLLQARRTSGAPLLSALIRTPLDTLSLMLRTGLRTPSFSPFKTWDLSCAPSSTPRPDRLPVLSVPPIPLWPSLWNTA